MPSRARRPFPRAFHRLLTVCDFSSVTGRNRARDPIASLHPKRAHGPATAVTAASACDTPAAPRSPGAVRQRPPRGHRLSNRCNNLRHIEPPARALAAANRHGRRTLRSIANPIARTPNPTSGSKSEPPGGRDAYTLRRRPRAGLRDGPRQLVTPVSCVDRPKRVIVYMHGQLPALLVSALDRSAVHFAWCRDRFARNHQRADFLAGAQPSRLADRRLGRRARDLRRKSHRT